MASRTRAVQASLALLAVSAWASPAPAQEGENHALAVRLFEEAGQAQDRHAYDEACPKFARVVELEPAKVGAKLALADCYEQAGKLASAVAAYRAAAARAAEIGDARSKLATERAAAIEARAPRVVIHLPEALRALPGITVLRDGAPLDASQWNQAVLSDPGEHTIYVAAPGRKPWSGKVTIIPGATAEIVIGALEELAPVLPAAPPPPPPASEPLALATPSRRVPVWAWITGGLGLASGGVAIAFAVDQAATQGDFDARCKNPPRDQQACDDRKVRLYRDFGLWIGLGAAGVAALGAATIGALAPRRGPVRASLWIAPQGAGAALIGNF